MRCKKFKEKIVFYLYGELDKKESAELEAHIKECSACSQDLEYTKNVFLTLDEVAKDKIPEADWGKSWKRIDAGLPETRPQQRIFGLVPGWVYAAAALVVVFVLGIFIGRYKYPSGQESMAQQELSQEFIQTSLKEHYENIKPVLVEYANYPSSKKGSESITIDKEIIRNLIIQNILLKRLITEKNPSAEQVLEDVDMVLREIENLEKQDTRTPALIKDLIYQRDILFKMEILQKT
jgi:hypothetical protein